MGYRGELMVSFKPRTSKWIIDTLTVIETIYNKIAKRTGVKSRLFENPLNKPPYEIGDRIAQIQINRYPTVVWNEVDKLGESERGTGGHGSTGN